MLLLVLYSPCLMFTFLGFCQKFTILFIQYNHWYMAHGTYLTTFDLLAKILFLSYGVWYAFGFVYLMKNVIVPNSLNFPAWNLFFFSFSSCEFLQEQNLNQSADDPSIEIESLLLMPVKHVSNYAQFVDGIFNEYKTRSLLDKEFKTIAAVEIEVKKLQKMVSENFALNSMRGSTVR